MKNNTTLFKAKSVLIATGLLATTFLATPRLAFADSAYFLNGNIMTATNNTSGNGTWSDPVGATIGQVIEFRIVAQNQSNVVANNVKVTANIGASQASSLQASATITADNAGATSDTATVNMTDGTTQTFEYIPGHERIYSTACPNSCTEPDNVTNGGINVGNLNPGDSVQVLFKAYVTSVTNAPTPTPTPTPSATVAPTAAPTVAPTTAPTNTIECPAGTTSTVNGSTIVCVQNTNTNNNSNSSSSSSSATGGSATVTINNPTTAPAPQVVSVAPTGETKQLPNTGLPIAAWGLGGLIPLGVKFRKFAGQAKDMVNPSFLWEKRNS